MKIKSIILILAITFTSCSNNHKNKKVAIKSGEANEMLQQGIEALNNNKYKEAYSTLRILKNTKNDISTHYYYACSLTLMLDSVETYFEDSYDPWLIYQLRDDIFQSLNIVIQDKSYIEKIKNDIRFKNLHSYHKYYKLLSFKIESNEDIDFLLQKIRYWGLEGMGVFDPISYITFNDGNSFKLNYIDNRGEALESGNYSFNIVGSYYTEILNTKKIVHLKIESSKIITLELNDSWELIFPKDIDFLQTDRRNYKPNY